MSLLDNTRSKVEKVREVTSPFSRMGVSDIAVESDFCIIEDILDQDKLMSGLNLIKSDIVPVVGCCDHDLYRRFAYYVCRWHLEHPNEYKLRYDDIIKDGKPRLPIILHLARLPWTTVAMDDNWKRILYVTLSNGSRMVIRYGL
jgi:hypothetical protein